MEWLLSAEDCCGCGSCVQACPVNCIEMKEGCGGFLYPSIDEEKCIHCGKCKKACPAVNVKKREYKEQIYAAASNDKQLLKKSSSGGMFGELARYIMDREGVVFGCAFDENMELRHSCATTPEECEKFHGSKYVQSNTNMTFKECEEKLEAGKVALFTGTPCQVAGLKSYLGREYDNLLTAEVLCHGVPSGGMWQRYIKELNELKGKKIRNASFRYQDQGWKKYRFWLQYEDGSEEIVPGEDSTYIKAFWCELSLRPSCYQCKYRLENSCSDFMIGDFWGIENYDQSWDTESGVSALFVLSEKGARVLNELNIRKEEKDISLITPRNACATMSAFPHRNSSKVYEMYDKGYPIIECFKENMVSYKWGERIPLLGLWGSYNVRLIALFLMNSSVRKAFHFSNSSIFSVMQEPCENVAEVRLDNGYRKAALLADWSKTFRRDITRHKGESDYFMFDLLEERFPLVEYDNSLVTVSDAYRDVEVQLDAGLVGEFVNLNMEEMEAGVRRFVNFITSYYAPDHIVMLENYLCESYMSHGKRISFDDESIAAANQKLKYLYDKVAEMCAGIKRITIEKKDFYADENHRYGLMPCNMSYHSCYMMADKIFAQLGVQCNSDGL